MTPKSENPPESMHTPSEYDTVDLWLEFLERQFQELLGSEQPVKHIDIFFLMAAQRQTKSTASWQIPGKIHEFQLSAALFLLQKADRFYMENKYQYAHHYIWSAVKDSADNILKTAGLELTALRPAMREHEGFLRVFSEWLHRAVFHETESPVDFLLFYRSWWRALKDFQGLILSEVQRLERFMRSAPSSSKLRHQAALLLIESYTRSGKDKAAAGLLKESPSLQMRDFAELLGNLYRSREWQRLYDWLHLLNHLQRRAPSDLFQTCMQYWKEACAALHRQEELTDIYAQLLPRSYYHYTSLLLESGKSADWVNFHLLNAVPPSALHPAEVQTVEERHPELLLPLYHQAIDKCIQQKNRASYREAISLIHKLKACYRSAGKPERFHAFIDKLMTEYGRLRALQEELRKGKLLT